MNPPGPPRRPTRPFSCGSTPSAASSTAMRTGASTRMRCRCGFHPVEVDPCTERFAPAPQDHAKYLRVNCFQATGKFPQHCFIKGIVHVGTVQPDGQNTVSCCGFYGLVMVHLRFTNYKLQITNDGYARAFVICTLSLKLHSKDSILRFLIFLVLRDRNGQPEDFPGVNRVNDSVVPKACGAEIG